MNKNDLIFLFFFKLKMFGFSQTVINKEDTALLISDEWKNKSNMCKNDFLNLIKEKKYIVEDYINKEDYENAEKEIIDIDCLRGFIEEIENINNEYKFLPFDLSVVSRIQFFEREIYKRYMTEEIIEKIKRREEDRQRITDTSQEMIERVDEMWDNNCSEEEIKNYILEQIKIMFPYNTEQINSFLTENFFITITAGKNVRVALTEEDINNLKKEKGRNGTCGTCLEDYDESSEMVVLKCGHAYHENCIVPWLKMSVYCPTCRQDLRN